MSTVLAQMVVGGVAGLVFGSAIDSMSTPEVRIGHGILQDLAIVTDGKENKYNHLKYVSFYYDTKRYVINSQFGRTMQAEQVALSNMKATPYQHGINDVMKGFLSIAASRLDEKAMAIFRYRAMLITYAAVLRLQEENKDNAAMTFSLLSFAPAIGDMVNTLLRRLHSGHPWDEGKADELLVDYVAHSIVDIVSDPAQQAMAGLRTITPPPADDLGRLVREDGNQDLSSFEQSNVRPFPAITPVVKNATVNKDDGVLAGEAKETGVTNTGQDGGTQHSFPEAAPVEVTVSGIGRKDLVEVPCVEGDYDPDVAASMFLDCFSFETEGEAQGLVAADEIAKNNGWHVVQKFVHLCSHKPKLTIPKLMVEENTLGDEGVRAVTRVALSSATVIVDALYHELFPLEEEYA